MQRPLTAVCVQRNADEEKKNAPAIRSGHFVILAGVFPGTSSQSTKCLPNCGVKALGDSGLEELEVSSRSTKCLPESTFLRPNRPFRAVFCCFPQFRDPCKRCDTAVKRVKSNKTSKILAKTENFVTEMLKLCVLPRPSRSPVFTENGPSHGRKN